MKPQSEKAFNTPRLRNASSVMVILLIAALALGIMGCSSRSASSGASSSEAQTTTQGITTSSAASTAASSTSTSTAKPSKNGFDETTNSTEAIAGMTFQIPSYYGSKADDGSYYAEKGSSVAMLNCSENEIDISPGEFEKGKELIASSILKSLGENTTVTERKDVVVAGLPGFMFSVKTKVNGINVDATFVFFFNEKIRKIGLLSLGQSENTKFDYSQDFQKIVNSAVMLEDPAHEAQAGVSPDLKEMLDSYEGFIDEYVSFMDKYKNSDNTTSLLLDYTNYLQKYSDLTQKMNAVDTSNLSGADYAYYIEVMTRCSTKLMNAAL